MEMASIDEVINNYRNLFFFVGLVRFFLLVVVVDLKPYSGGENSIYCLFFFLLKFFLFC